MRPAPRSNVVAGIATGSVRCATAAIGVLIVAAVAVSLAGLADETRSILRFGFGGVDRSPAEVASIAIHNARFAGGTLLCAAIAPRLTRRARRVVDLVLGTLLAFNAGAVGIAVGAYGARAVSATALHLPVEFSALSIAGGAYMQACKQALTGRELAVVGATTALVLVVAAALETYVSIGGTR